MVIHLSVWVMFKGDIHGLNPVAGDRAPGFMAQQTTQKDELRKDFSVRKVQNTENCRQGHAF